jgi:uncharacterized protein with PhoU and TrkA domain
MDDKPRNLKTLLAEAKDASELMVDLAYAALYFDDEGMAESVLGLEEEMSDLVHEMRSLAMLAVRHPREVDVRLRQLERDQRPEHGECLSVGE